MAFLTVVRDACTLAAIVEIFFPSAYMVRQIARASRLSFGLVNIFSVIFIEALGRWGLPTLFGAAKFVNLVI